MSRPKATLFNLPEMPLQDVPPDHPLAHYVYESISGDFSAAPGSDMGTQHVVAQLTMLNQQIFEYINNLNVRLSQVEQDNERMRSMLPKQERPCRPILVTRDYRGVVDDRSRSPSAEIPVSDPAAQADNVFAGTAASLTAGQPSARKQLHVQVAGHGPNVAARFGLPTPITGELPIEKDGTSLPTASIPATPATPLPNWRPPLAITHKRKAHGLSEKMVPANTQLPMIPVTDLELIIYFYNLVSRPMVALRLYARGWGPARITNALNKYRKPDPPYLRNTCTVKCNTAFKRGKEMYGEDWHEVNHEKFQHVDDCDATDMIYDSIKGNDLCDPDLLEVADGLVEYPDDVELGPLTKCIRYCAENGIHCPVSRAHEIAMGLEGGEMPEEFLVKVKTGTNESSEIDPSIARATDDVDVDKEAEDDCE